MRQKKKKELKEQEYIVMNQQNEVYSGMKDGGEFQWTMNWYDAKPLEYSNTVFLRMFNSKAELIKTQDFY
jgi:hypothetical protein